MMDNQTAALQDYIRTQIICNPAIAIDADTALVSSGLIDSFALVDILVKLEEVTGRKLPVSQISAQDLDSVNMMLATAERLGRPRGGA
jgi:acyl carrier protein